MNGNVEGVMTCANSGLSVNDKDDESWAPLHYACWYDATHTRLCCTIIYVAHTIISQILSHQRGPVRRLSPVKQGVKK